MTKVNLKTSGGKKIRDARSKINSECYYTLDDGIDLIKNVAYTKFDQTLEVILKLGVNPKHSDQMVRGVVSMPSGIGKSPRILVVCNESRATEAREFGADIVGSKDIIEDIKAGNINFDVCIATPDVMPLISQVAKILGPKGLMPNPKLGTVTNDIALAIKNAKSGQVEFRIDKGGIIHAGVGKLSFSIEELKINVLALISAVVKAKPKNAKGTYLKKGFLSSTMGPGIKISISDDK